jgi:hypothetical protein
MVQGRETFWSAVYPLFMSRDLTRSDLHQLIFRGLQESGGSYKILTQLFNLPPGEYKRFLNFLHKHASEVRFQVLRSVKRHYASAGPTPLMAEAADRGRRNASENVTARRDSTVEDCSAPRRSFHIVRV